MKVRMRVCADRNKKVENAGKRNKKIIRPGLVAVGWAWSVLHNDDIAVWCADITFCGRLSRILVGLFRGEGGKTIQEIRRVDCYKQYSRARATRRRSEGVDVL